MSKSLNVFELAQGAIQEQTANELQKVLDNLMDPNTDVKTVRKLTITLAFKTDENREQAACTAQAKATLAPVKPIATGLFLDTDFEGKAVAAEIIREKGSAIAAEIEADLVAENVLQFNSK